MLFVLLPPLWTIVAIIQRLTRRHPAAGPATAAPGPAAGLADAGRDPVGTVTPPALRGLRAV